MRNRGMDMAMVVRDGGSYVLQGRGIYMEGGWREGCGFWVQE